MNNKTHEIHWDKEKIQAFWNNLGTSDSLEALYFSRQKGRSILRFVQNRISIRGRVVDLGCGPGYFVDQLLAADVSCEGADLSPDSVEKLNQRLKGNELFHGAKPCGAASAVPFPAGSVDILFFLETMEHLLPGDREQCLKNIHDALADGGHLVITVPLQENLEEAKVVCPDCGCRFHQVQHVESYSPASLRKLLEQHGFTTVVCKPTILLPDWRIYIKALKIEGRKQRMHCPECGHGFRAETGFCKKLLGKFRFNKIYHLVYIGQKQTVASSLNQ